MRGSRRSQRRSTAPQPTRLNPPPRRLGPPRCCPQIVPFLYGPKPALLRLGSGIPYSQITAAVRRDAKLAVGFGVALLVGLLITLIAKLLKVA
jgi:hypothetical protein